MSIIIAKYEILKSYGVNPNLMKNGKENYLFSYFGNMSTNYGEHHVLITQLSLFIQILKVLGQKPLANTLDLF